jgi:hypothetical protein
MAMRTTSALTACLLMLAAWSQPGPRVLAKADLDRAQQQYTRGALDSAMALADAAIAKDHPRSVGRLQQSGGPLAQ